MDVKNLIDILNQFILGLHLLLHHKEYNIKVIISKYLKTISYWDHLVDYLYSE